jgi:hypothetical protein
MKEFNIVKWSQQHGDIIEFHENWRLGTVRCKDCVRIRYKNNRPHCLVERNGQEYYPPIHTSINHWRKCARFEFHDPELIDTTNALIGKRVRAR